MSAIEKTKLILERFPAIDYQCDHDRISASPDGGFTVELVDNGKETIVSCGGWHEDFKDEDEAVMCFFFGLSDQCRLKINRRGKTEYRWTVQFMENGKWINESVTGLLLYPFWRKKTVEHLQNNAIDLSKI